MSQLPAKSSGHPPAGKRAAPVKKKGKRKKKGRNSGFALPLVLFVIATFLIMRHSSVFFVAGMLPTIVTAIVDQGRPRYHLRIVGCMNLAGILPYMAELYRQDNNATAVRQVMGDPSSWLIIWLYAGTGWMLWFLMPKIVALLINFFSDNKVSALEDEQEKLVGEWGEGVKSSRGGPVEDDGLDAA